MQAFVAQAAEDRRRRVPRVRLPELGREHARRDGRGGRGGQGLRRRDLLHRRHPRPRPGEVRPQILCRAWRKELKAAGAHVLGLKDMAGLLKPAAARVLIKALKRGDRPADPLPHP